MTPKTKARIENSTATNGRRAALLTPEQAEFVRRGYKSMSRKELIKALNDKFNLSLKIGQLVYFIKKHKIKSGRTGFFKPGQGSWNKGKKGYMGANKTSFKEGNKPKNYRPIGSERVESKSGYVLIKVSDQKPHSDCPAGWYRYKHVVLWEEHNGPVPEGHCIRFKDGNRLNITIDNLVLVSRGEHARLTRMEYGSQPDEIKPVLLNIAKIDQAISERT